MYQPLADALRPQELSDVCGQQHILGENGLLRRIIESGAVPNMIFYGPSGTGKTTVANLIAKKTQRKLCKLNATTASSADIKEIYAQLDTFLAPNGVLLYLDEIQYFNKKQQQTLLEYIENGKITLIASTTENPYFYVYNAILSRSTVFEFKPVEKDEAQRAVSRALNYLEARDSVTILPEPGVKEHIAQSCGGDIRKALNAVRTTADLRALLDADRGLVDDFVRYAARKGVAPRYGDIARSRQLMEAQLKAYIGRNTSLEDSGYFLSIYPEDEVIVRAIGELEHPTIPTVKAAEAVAEGEPAEEQPAEEEPAEEAPHD